MTQIIAISNQDDPHIGMVQEHLDTEILLIDPTQTPLNKELSYIFEDGKFTLIYNGQRLDSLKSVWFRKPRYLTQQEMPVEKDFQEFSHLAYMSHVHALYDLLSDKFWLSPFRNITRASNKLWQIELANKLGFNVPQTIMTSSPTEASQFWKKHKYVVAKSHDFSTVEINGQMMGFYTSRLDPNEETDFSGLPLAPALFQQEIRNKLDIRITMVGKRIFPCAIKPIGEIKDEVDWRIGTLSKECEYVPYNDLPGSLITMCHQYLSLLGLPFGVIEFALDSDGRYWFLEVNANGQWGFVEREAGMNISKAIAMILQSGGDG